MKPPMSAEMAIAKAQQAEERCRRIVAQQLQTDDIDEHQALEDELELRMADKTFYTNIAFAPVAGVYDDEKEAALN